MKRTPIALCLAALAFTPAQAHSTVELSQSPNCVEPSAPISCLRAQAWPRSWATPTSTARAAVDAYRAQGVDLIGGETFNISLPSSFELAEAQEAGRSVGEIEAQPKGWRLDAVLDMRSLWAGSKDGGSFQLAQAVTPEQLDKALADHMAQRDFWNRAEAGAEGQPVGVPQNEIDAALAALLEERASWGTSPSKRVADFNEDQRGWNLTDILNLRALLGGRSETAAGTSVSQTATPEQVDEALKALLAQREMWAAGKADSAADVAPVASQADVIPDGQPVASAKAGPGAAASSGGSSMQAVSQDEIRAALDGLLKERASWGTAPWDSPPGKSSDVAEKTDPGMTAELKQAKEPGQAGYASLPTVDLESLLRARAIWGSGSIERVVEAPLAAGAVFPLPKAERSAVAENVPDPIIHAAEITPVAQLKQVAAEDIDAALASLFQQRKAWGDGVSASKAEVASNEAVGASAAAKPVLTTSSLDELLKQRAAWGAGLEAAPVTAPLAAGAEFPLPKPPVRAAVEAVADPIIHAADNAPVAELTPIAPEVLATALSGLLAERATWGTEPTIGDGERPYASLSTSSLEELLGERAKWGMGGTAEPVVAPLAAGAVVPLPKQDAKVVDDNAADPIIHAGDVSLPVKLTDIAPEALAKALKDVLAERAAAGKSPGKAAKVAKANGSSKTPAVAAKPAKDKAPGDALAALLKERESFGKAPTRLPERKTVEAKTEDVAALVTTDATVSSVETRNPDGSYANLSTESLSQLLNQRDQWGEPGAGVSAPASSEAADKPAPTQTGALAPYETAATTCGRELASIVAARPIEFGPSSAAIGSGSRAVLKQIGELARSCPGVRFRIEGHTDASGTAAKNQILSEARARSVMQYLLAFGIEKSRLSAVGFGESRPVASNDSASDRAKNRRIEFVPVIE